MLCTSFASCRAKLAAFFASSHVAHCCGALQLEDELSLLRHTRRVPSGRGSRPLYLSPWRTLCAYIPPRYVCWCVNIYAFLHLSHNLPPTTRTTVYEYETHGDGDIFLMNVRRRNAVQRSLHFSLVIRGSSSLPSSTTGSTPEKPRGTGIWARLLPRLAFFFCCENSASF